MAITFPPAHVTSALPTARTDEPAIIDLLIDGIDHVNAATHGMDPTNAAATNTAALQDAIDFAAAHRYPLYIPTFADPYILASVAHPNPNITGWKGVAAHRGQLEVFGNPAAMPELKLVAGATLNTGAPGSRAQNRFWTNWDPNAVVGVDEWIYLHHLILNGNAANNTATGKVMHGAQFWNARHVFSHDMVYKNMRGDDTGNFETFHLDAVLCQDVHWERNVALTDDGSETASGLSVNFCDRYWIVDNTVLDMANGQGITRLKSSNGHTYGNYAGGCASSGLNCEHSLEEEWGNFSGSGTNPLDPSHTSHAYTKGQGRPNAVGYTYLFSQGGSVKSWGNVAAGNTVRGVGVSGTLTATASATGAGTSALTVTTTTATFFPGHVGSYIQVGGHGWVQIATYVSSTQVTTDAAHSGAPTNTVLVRTVDLEWEGRISGSPNGFQPLDTDALKPYTMRGVDLNGTKFDNNGNDLVDVGNPTKVSVLRASGQIPTVNGYTAGTEFYNPFGRDLWAIVAGSSGNTSTRSRHPKDVAQSWGIGDGIFPLEAGGAITCTGTLTLRFQ